MVFVVHKNGYLLKLGYKKWVSIEFVDQKSGYLLELGFKKVGISSLGINCLGITSFGIKFLIPHLPS